MRIATAYDLAPAASRFNEVRPRLAGYRMELTDHPIAGRSLVNYLLLTDCPDLLADLALTDEERFWSRYYWLARFAREWQAAAGPDAGIEQQMLQLLEEMDGAYAHLVEIEAAVERDAVVNLIGQTIPAEPGDTPDA